MSESTEHFFIPFKVVLIPHTCAGADWPLTAFLSLFGKQLFRCLLLRTQGFLRSFPRPVVSTGPTGTQTWSQSHIPYDSVMLERDIGGPKSGNPEQVFPGVPQEDVLESRD